MKPEEKRFAAIVTTDIDAATHGFFWCGGFNWNSRDYRCIVVALPSVDNRRHRLAAIELRADSPENLAKEMAAHALDPLPVETIRRSCEWAGCSPQPTP